MKLFQTKIDYTASKDYKPKKIGGAFDEKYIKYNEQLTIKEYLTLKTLDYIYVI